MYQPTAFLTPGVHFTNPHTTQVYGWHTYAGLASQDGLAPLDQAGAPVRVNVEPAQTAIANHQVLNELAGDGFTAAAADQAQLSVDDQLQPDGTITGHVDAGEQKTDQGVVPLPTTLNGDWTKQIPSV